jgi:hypothetical protein
MTAVWNKVEQLAGLLKEQFLQTGKLYSEADHNGWENYLYSSERYRRAHVEIVDFRKTHNLYILHSTVFPHYTDTSPIWGFDAVCGPSKITGAFHDFSSAGNDNHFMMTWFSEETKTYKWRKPRQLPPWAQAIFSPSMIAAGNVREGEELDDLCSIAENSLNYYLANVGKTSNSSSVDAQNRYCYYQKQNPHVINSMVAMGIPRDDMIKFVNDILFPETLNIE